MISKRTTPILLTIALAMAALCGGCQAAAAWWTIFVKYETIKPVFELPAGKKVLVFPDDAHNPLSYPPARRALAKTVNDMLAEKKVAADIVPYDELLDLAAADPDFNKLDVASVGRKLGADLVIYIVLDPLRLKDTPTDSLWHGRFGGRARVVDVKKGRIWPEEPEGRQVDVSDPAKENSSEAYGERLALNLSEDLGEKIGFLFTKHKEEIMRMPKGKFDAMEN